MKWMSYIRDLVIIWGGFVALLLLHFSITILAGKESIKSLITVVEMFTTPWLLFAMFVVIVGQLPLYRYLSGGPLLTDSNND